MESFPLVRTIGLSGILVTFSKTISDTANKAAIAFRGAVDAQSTPGVLETSVSLASTYISYDPETLPLEALKDHLQLLIKSQDWLQSPLPTGRKLWHIPAAFGAEAGPQLAEVAELAGMTQQQAVTELTSQPVRVLTIGFAPGLPYLGTLPTHWDIPRQSELTAQVPAGALVVAVRQLVLFTNPSPTGWRHIAQTAFQNFRPENAQPFSLQIGDEVKFQPVSVDELRAISDSKSTENGGAHWELIP